MRLEAGGFVCVSEGARTAGCCSSEEGGLPSQEAGLPFAEAGSTSAVLLVGHLPRGEGQDSFGPYYC